MDGSKLVLELDKESIVELGRYVERSVIHQQIMVSRDPWVMDFIYYYLV